MLSVKITPPQMVVGLKRVQAKAKLGACFAQICVCSTSYNQNFARVCSDTERLFPGPRGSCRGTASTQLGLVLFLQ